MRKIFTKFFLGFILVIVLLAFFTAYFFFEIISSNYQENLINDLVNLNHTLDNSIIPFIREQQYQRLDSAVKSIGKEINIRITIINPKGVVLADSKSIPREMENHSDRPEVQKALEKGIGVALRNSHTVKKDMLYVAIPIRENNILLAVSRMSVYNDDIESLLGELRWQLFKIIALIMLFSLIIAFFISRTITKPVKELVNVTGEVAMGNFNISAFVRSNDELRLLGDSINNMIEKIRDLFTRVNLQKEELGNIISSMTEGLVLIDSYGKILLSNARFNSIVQNNDINEKFFWEVIRDRKINKIFKKLMETGEGSYSDVLLNGCYYLCSASQINYKKDIVMIFYDISEMKKLEQVKKDFITNVSHELRTPLTVISGYIETIGENSSGENLKYLDIISKHTNRLINIVNDLLIISELEDKKIRHAFAAVNLNNLILDVVSTFEQKANEKKIELRAEFLSDFPEFAGDAFKLEQMLINLIDNALKYTEEGKITISLSLRGKDACIEITDTGIGIPEKETERIFERFYTVDKSRSRQLSGTGLGLSIVKHIVMLHQGKISVESKSGSGSKFKILLPFGNENNVTENYEN